MIWKNWRESVERLYGSRQATGHSNHAWLLAAEVHTVDSSMPLWLDMDICVQRKDLVRSFATGALKLMADPESGWHRWKGMPAADHKQIWCDSAGVKNEIPEQIEDALASGQQEVNES